MDLNPPQLESGNDRLKSGYDSLLLGYAAGILDDAQKLIVDAHMSYSDSAREFVYSCEAIGGALIDNHCNDIEMNAGSLESVLSKLDDHDGDNNDQNITKPAQRVAHDDIDFDMPAVLSKIVSPQIERFKWKSLFPGMRGYDLDMDCETSSARLLQAKPGTKSPNHRHAGTEITLVLDGSFEDVTGHYKTGDLLVIDENCEHSPIACKIQGCTCFVVSTAPIKLTGIASVLNPFLKR